MTTEKLPCALGQPHQDCPNVLMASVGLKAADKRIGWLWVAIIVIGYFVTGLWITESIKSWSASQFSEFMTPREISEKLEVPTQVLSRVKQLESEIRLLQEKAETPGRVFDQVVQMRDELSRLSGELDVRRDAQSNAP